MDLQKYLLLSGMLALGYGVYHYATRPSKSSGSHGPTISVEKTIKILQQIKHQIFVTCVSFVDTVLKNKQGAQKLPNAAQKQRIDAYFREQLSNIYAQKQDLILKKHDVTKQQYADALNKYGADKRVRSNQKQIVDMMERAIKDTYPDFTVPREAQIFNVAQIGEIYKTMCLHVATLVLEKLLEFMDREPGFNPKDDANFKKAIKEISIYDRKVEFFVQRGIKPEWGCPNEIFFKLLENQKCKNQAFKKQMNIVQKTYEKAIELVSNEPQNFTRQSLAQFFNNGQLPNQSGIQQVQPQKPVVNDVRMPITNVSPPPPPFGGISRKPVQAKQPQIDLDEMMMRELMSRTEEKSKQEPVQKKEEKVEQKTEEKKEQKKEQKNEEAPKQEEKQQEKLQEFTEEAADIEARKLQQLNASHELLVSQSAQLEQERQRERQALLQQQANRRIEEEQRERENQRQRQFEEVRERERERERERQRQRIQEQERENQRIYEEERQKERIAAEQAEKAKLAEADTEHKDAKSDEHEEDNEQRQ